MLVRPFRAFGLALIRLARAILRPSRTMSAGRAQGDRVVFRHYV